MNLHFHVLSIDGVFSPRDNSQQRFHRVNASTSKELNELVVTISEGVARYLERHRRPARDGRWILHKEEAAMAMAAWWRLIKCQMSDGVGCWAQQGCQRVYWQVPGN